MAGMFYSLQEVAEKLNKSEDEVKEIVRQGKLREFRDGPNLLFKVDEVETLLMSDTSIAASQEGGDEGSLEIALEPEEEPVAAEAEETAPPLEMAEEQPLDMEIEPEMEIAPSQAQELPQELEEVELEIPMAAEPSSELLPEVKPLEETGDRMSLEETTQPPVDRSLADDDTVIANEGVSVLGETDSDYQLTDDTMGETQLTPEETSLLPSEDDTSTTSADELSLEEIEEDVNLDTFGSGSGLLDLSLQADDTSLGGILDEIYTPEGEEDKSVGSASVLDVAADTEQMLAEVGGPSSVGTPAMAKAYVEPEPDSSSNILGVMLFLPLIAVFYTAIVIVGSLSNVTPTILKGAQGIIWYIAGGTAAVAMLIAGVALMTGGSGKSAGKKSKVKTKKAKKKKVKKPKKEKKGKKAKS